MSPVKQERVKLFFLNLVLKIRYKQAKNKKNSERFLTTVELG